jgi:hypothetical protein
MALRSCANCGDRSALALRVLVTVDVVAFVLLVAFGATVERPINSAPAVCMILLGVANCLTALSGFFASSRFSCCLDVFLVVNSVNVLLTAVLVGELFMNFDGLTAAIGARAVAEGACAPLVHQSGAAAAAACGAESSMRDDQVRAVRPRMACTRARVDY